jgi:hypothetical protein
MRNPLENKPSDYYFLFLKPVPIILLIHDGCHIIKRTIGEEQAHEKVRTYQKFFL